MLDLGRMHRRNFHAQLLRKLYARMNASHQASRLHLGSISVSGTTVIDLREGDSALIIGHQLAATIKVCNKKRFNFQS